MASPGNTSISLYYSATTGHEPIAGNLVNGELAINIADGKLFYKDNLGVVKTFSSGGGGGGGFDAGTRLLFAQTSAPTGWTKDTVNYNNYAIRVVTGTASTGGSVDFTTAFSSKTPTGSVSSSGSSGNTTATGSVSVSGGSVGSTTLSTSQIPSHNHTFSGINQTQYLTAGTSGLGLWISYSDSGAIGSTGGGGSHTHSFTTPSASFSGSAHNHTISVSSSFTGDAINLAVKYLDVITATKD